MVTIMCAAMYTKLWVLLPWHLVFATPAGDGFVARISPVVASFLVRVKSIKTLHANQAVKALSGRSDQKVQFESKVCELCMQVTQTFEGELVVLTSGIRRLP